MTRRKVTPEEFYALLEADPRDIMPRITNNKYPYTTEWAEQGTGRIFGWSSDVDGYENGVAKPDECWIPVPKEATHAR